MENLKSVLESQVGSLTYRRFAAKSQILGREVHFGRIRPGPFESFVPDGVIYLFHAGNGDDQQLVQEGVIATIQDSTFDLLRNRKVELVLPFIGTSFLHDYPGEPARAFSKFFFEELVPFVEGSMSKNVRRYVYGLSMGGFAALSAFFSRPEMFAGAAAQMPALFNFDYQQPSEVEAFVKRTGAQKEAVEFLLTLLKPEFKDLADYHQADPLKLIQRFSAQQLRGKVLCLQVGTADAFGCFEGTELLHQELEKGGIPHEYELVQGGTHDASFVIPRFPGLLQRLLA